MSRFLFCCACGHPLTLISYLRLKCYGCEKMFAFSWDDNEAVCRRCRRDDKFRYSMEIITPQKCKCFCCGHEKKITRSLEPPYRDHHRGGESKSLGSWDGQVGPRTIRRPKEKPPEIEKPEVDYVSEDQIIIRFPGHNVLDQIRYEIVNGVLEVQSLLVDFLQKFKLPDFPIELITDLRNGVLDIHLQRKAKK